MSADVVLSLVLTSNSSIGINISMRSLCASEDSRGISTSISFLLMLMLMLMLASLVRTGLNQIAKYILSVHLSSQ